MNDDDDNRYTCSAARMNEILQNVHFQPTTGMLNTPYREVTDGCWTLPDMRHDEDGYVDLSINGITCRSHHVFYRFFIGKMRPIHDFAGCEVVDCTNTDHIWQIDHLCMVPDCVRPDHLENVTQRENILRSNCSSALHARQVNCDAGHPFEGDNLYSYTDKDGGSHRYCRACQAVREAERDKEAANARHRNLYDKKQAALGRETYRADPNACKYGHTRIKIYPKGNRACLDCRKLKYATSKLAKVA